MSGEFVAVREHGLSRRRQQMGRQRRQSAEKAMGDGTDRPPRVMFGEYATYLTRSHRSIPVNLLFDRHITADYLHVDHCAAAVGTSL